MYRTPHGRYQASAAPSAPTASLVTAVCMIWTIATALYSAVCSHCYTCGLCETKPCHVLLWPATHRSTGMGVPVSLQTPVVALGAVDELPDLHRTRPCEGRKSGVQAGMHRCSRSGRTYEPLIELLQQQAGLAAGRSWQARLAVWKVGDRRTEVTKMRKTSPGRLLAVARCARSARSGDSLR